MIVVADFFSLDYGCALQREILIQGRLYISENHMCFHANLFGWVTDVSCSVLPRLRLIHNVRLRSLRYQCMMWSLSINA
jgi:hypothetical protein